MTFRAGDKALVKTSSKQVTIIAASGEYALVRTQQDCQWTYRQDELTLVKPPPPEA